MSSRKKEDNFDDPFDDPFEKPTICFHEVCSKPSHVSAETHHYDFNDDLCEDPLAGLLIEPIRISIPNIPLPKKPDNMPDDLWATYVDAHEHALSTMRCKNSMDENYYCKLMRNKLGGLTYDLCLKYFRMDSGS